MSYETKNIRNVCLLGHGGSGKTTLAESMLYMTGAIDRQGKTADGNTVCDYDPEEIKRQITISTSIAPVNFGGCKINVLDCPGFFDFAGDVMCALRAVEAGIIFCTAKDGIAVGAERSWKYLKNANMPCMFYVSKTNEDHGDFAAVLSALQEKHGSAVCAVTAPMSDGTGVIDLVHNVAYQTNGNKTAKVAVPAADADMVESLRETLFETAAGADEELMEKYFEDMMLSEEDTVKGLRQGLKDRTVFPVLCGAADSGIGTEAVLQAIVDYVPNPAEVGEVATADGGKLAIDPNGPVCAFVFKTISDQFGKYSFIKVLSGKVTSDLSLRNVRMSSTDKLGRMYTMCGKKNTEVKEACCGDIVAIGKMEWKTGDTVCDPKHEVELPAIELAEPCYSMAISPKTKGQDDKVASGLARLNEEDISFTLVNNAETHQMVVSGVCPPQLSGSETAPLTVGTVDSIDAARFAGFCYAALGHIHRAQRVGIDAVRYAGAPLCYHLDECGMQKSVTLVRVGKRGVEKIEQLPLTPRRAMRHLTGPLARLTARPTDTEDYIWATLTDPTPLPDAMAQLRAAYPNAMRLDYLPQGEVAHPLDMTQAVRGKPFVELFQDFFTKMNGRPLTVEETVAVKRLREEASKSE